MGADNSRPVDLDDAAMAEKQREILRMDQIVRNKVRSGVQYNMKVILRGERGAGKTTLWKRFQGMSYEEAVSYIHQSHTNVTSKIEAFCSHIMILWNH